MDDINDRLRGAGGDRANPTDDWDQKKIALLSATSFDVYKTIFRQVEEPVCLMGRPLRQALLRDALGWRLSRLDGSDASSTP